MFLSHQQNVPDFDALELSGELVFVPAGGAENLAYWASKLQPINRPEFHLFDRDAPYASTPKHQAKVEAVNLRSGCKAVSTARREMENYVHYQAINNYATSHGYVCDLTAQYGFDDDVPQLLKEKLNSLNPNSHDKWGQSRVKRWLAESVLPTMTSQMVAEIDPKDEMLGWLDDIRAMLEQSAASSHG